MTFQVTTAYSADSILDKSFLLNPIPENIKSSKFSDLQEDEYNSVKRPSITTDKFSNYSQYTFQLKNNFKYQVIPTFRKMNPDNSYSVIGYFKSLPENKNFYAVFTYSQKGIIGDFYLPSGHYMMDIKDGENILYSPVYFNRNNIQKPFEFDQLNVNKSILNKALASGVEPTSSATTQLNVGIVISNSAGDFNTAKSHIYNAFNIGNQQLANSNVEINLNLKFITSVKQNYEQYLPNDIGTSNANFKNYGTDLIDFDSPNLTLYGTNQSNLNMHQLVLVVGSSSNICGMAGNPRQLGIYSTYVKSNTCPKITLIHEIGHNLTLVHEDGACKTSEITNTTCEYLGGGGVNPKPKNVGKDPLSPTSTDSWRSVMMSSGKSALLFTGGANNNITSDICFGICNTAPFDTHNSIDRLNNIRSAAANNFISIELNQTQPDQYDDIAIRGYTDDYEGDAESILINAPQTHNLHDAGDQDWTMVWVQDNATFEFKTEMFGANSATNFEVYKVTYAEVRPNSTNRFINISKTLVASGTNYSPKIISAEGGFLYIMKVYSSNSSYGSNTNYRVSINYVPIIEDQYDNVSIRGYSDDYDGDGAPIFGNIPQTHNFHKQNDKDWTMFWIDNTSNINTKLNKIGHNSHAKLSFYKVTDFILNPEYVNDPDPRFAGRYSILSKTLLGVYNSEDNIPTLNLEGGFLYLMKVESSIGAFGYGTEYEIEVY